MPVLPQPLVAFGLHRGHHLVELRRDSAPRRVQLAIARALRVLGLLGRLDNQFPLDVGLRGDATVGLERLARILFVAVLKLHRVEEALLRVLRSLVHLRRAEQRLEAAVEERERAVGHLELCGRGEFVVELFARAVLLLRQRANSLCHEVNEPSEVARVQQLRALLLTQLLDIRKVASVAGGALGKVERARDNLGDAARRQELGRRPCGPVLLLLCKALESLLRLLRLLSLGSLLQLL